MARGLIVSVLGMFVMACSGCGGGAGGSAQPTAAAQPVQLKPVNVLWAGDSTSIGSELIDGKYVRTDAVRQYLQDDMQAKAGNTVTVSGNGIGGTTLEQLLAGTGGYVQPYAQFISSTSGNPVVENFGLNEWQVTPDQFKQSLIQFITLTEQAGKIPVLEEPNPSCTPGTPNQDLVYQNGLTMAAYVDVIDQVAQSYNVTLIHQYAQIREMQNFCTLMSDGIQHPGNTLYAIKAQNQASALLPIVESLQK